MILWQGSLASFVGMVVAGGVHAAWPGDSGRAHAAPAILPAAPLTPYVFCYSYSGLAAGCANPAASVPPP